MNAFKQQLAATGVEGLALPYELATGLSGAKATKKTMVAGLAKAFDWPLEGCHEKYLSGVDTEQKMAVESYRRDGYVFMNDALRTGRMAFELNTWKLVEDIRKAAPTTTAKDVAAFAKEPGNFVRTLYARSELDTVIIESMSDSAAVSLQRWQLLSDMRRVVEGAPPRSKSTVLWRGESYAAAFHTPVKLMDKTRHSHGESMKALKQGSTFTRPDFSSFSMSVTTASSFAGEGCCMYRLTLSKTDPALFMASYTNPRENEVILPPGTKFKVTKVQTLKSKVATGAAMHVFWIKPVS
jgi:hypothetical protein